jgi:hypothetical protein
MEHEVVHFSEIPTGIGGSSWLMAHAPSPWQWRLVLCVRRFFLTVVTARKSVARRSLSQHHWTPAIATLTVVFAAGQVIGPVLTRAISERPSGLGTGLGVSARFDLR